LKLSSTHAHNARSTCRGPATAPNMLGQRGPQSAWHGSQWLTGGYPMAKLYTADDSSDGAPPGMAWPEAEAVDRPRRGPHGVQCTALARGMALPVTADDWTAREKHPWTLVHLPDMVPGAELKRGGWTTELNGGECADPSGWGAALGSGEALGPAYGERGWVRWLGTNEVAKNRGVCVGDGVHCVEAT
jgi:hypothetical protein